jgi:hypothetical protein
MRRFGKRIGLTFYPWTHLSFLNASDTRWKAHATPALSSAWDSTALPKTEMRLTR